jgi:hypothetical protein
LAIEDCENPSLSARSFWVTCAALLTRLRCLIRAMYLGSCIVLIIACMKTCFLTYSKSEWSKINKLDKIQPHFTPHSQWLPAYTKRLDRTDSKSALTTSYCTTHQVKRSVPHIRVFKNRCLLFSWPILSLIPYSTRSWYIDSSTSSRISGSRACRT